MPKRYKLTQEEITILLTNPWLTDRERKICRLFYVNGWTTYDIAEDIGKNGMSRSTVLKDLSKARHKANIHKK